MYKQFREFLEEIPEKEQEEYIKEYLIRKQKFIRDLKRNGSNFKTFYTFRDQNLYDRIRLNISIRIRPNNVFYTLKNKLTQEVLVSKSAGKYGLNISKKKLKFSNKIVLKKFLKDIILCRKERLLLLTITAPKKYRRFIIQKFTSKFRRSRFFIDFKNLKCFNGCGKKKKTKKT